MGILPSNHSLIKGKHTPCVIFMTRLTFNILIPKNLIFKLINNIFIIMTKAANIYNQLREFAENRVEDLVYGKYLLEHKYNVLKGGLELGHPIWPLLKHDWSKFKPKNWIPYREKFFGQNTPKNQKLFRNAVQDHINSEVHHDYKYKDPHDIIEPNAENYADWWALQKYYYPETTPDSIKKWLKNRKKN